MKHLLEKAKCLCLAAALLLTLVSCSTSTNVTQNASSNQATTSNTEVLVDAENEAIEESGTSDTSTDSTATQTGETYFTADDIPTYRGNIYVTINDGIPFFSDSDLTTTSFESYSDLDALGRCGVALASVGLDIMPTEDRESISSVYPTGWVQATYSTDLVSGGYLYNRSHLIGFQLTGENANAENLITGTRAFNVDAMLLFENMVADYVQETGNHVYYRVTPVFKGDNLLASGVLMEAKSVEDDGEGVLFCAFCYNVQDGITIDYATGESWLSSSISSSTSTASIATTAPTTNNTVTETALYILNTSSKKIHTVDCHYVDQMSEANKLETNASLASLHAQGYEDCKGCNPE